MRQARTIIPAFYLEAFAESISGLGILSRASRFDELWKVRYKFGAAEIARKIGYHKGKGYRKKCFKKFHSYHEFIY